MAFQLSEAVNKDKVFLVKRSELEGRLDPSFYLPKYRALTDTIRKSTNSCLYNLVEFSNKQWDQSSVFQNTFPYIEIGEIDTSTGDIKTITDVTVNEAPSRAKMIVSTGDLLVSTTRPTRGAIALFEGRQAIASTGFCVITMVNSDRVNKLYLFYVLRSHICLNQMGQRSSGGNYPAITTEELKKILIPLPHLEKQNEIVTRMNTAYVAKKQKEAQAHLLLDSMDAYLLNELAIELPAEEENAIKQRMFVRKFSEVSGGRFDAPGNWIKLSLKSGVFENAPFSEVVAINPITDFGFSDNSTPATFLPMESISELYAEANITQAREIGDAKGYTTFQDGDLLWAKITPCMENGKSAVVQGLTNGIGFGSTEYHVFRSKGSVNIHYIHALLRLKLLRSTAVNFFSGSAGHQRVDELFFRNLSISLPPLEKQNEIAAHIQMTRDQAKQLRAEAAAGLEQAKREVEAMILGQH